MNTQERITQHFELYKNHLRKKKAEPVLDSVVLGSKELLWQEFKRIDDEVFEARDRQLEALRHLLNYKGTTLESALVAHYLDNLINLSDSSKDSAAWEINNFTEQLVFGLMFDELNKLSSVQENGGCYA